MKTYLLSVLLSIFIFANASAEYESGDIDFNLGGGIGIYSVSSNATDTSTLGANTLWNLTASYAIMPNLSVGYTFERNKFLGTDDSDSVGAYAFSNNHKMNIVFRMINKEKNVLALGTAFGLSMLEYGNNQGDIVTSSGMTYEFGLTYQHLFGEHFGYYLNGAYSSYRYSKITDQDGDVWKVDNSTTDAILKLSGLG